MKIIGTDSKQFLNFIKYCTCILDTETGMLEKHFTTRRILPRHGRLHEEAAITLMYADVFKDYEVELHFDYSPNPKHKSHPIYLAYKGLGKFKPEAFMASSVADYFLDH